MFVHSNFATPKLLSFSLRNIKCCLDNIFLALDFLQNIMKQNKNLIELNPESLIVRKLVFRVYDYVRYKPGCTTIENG